MAPTDTDGNILREGDYIHPLNVMKGMKETDPKLYAIYQKVVAKYEGRKLFVPGISIPSLEGGTTWGDVVQLSPIHPDDLRTALKAAGFELGDAKFYQIDPDTLDKNLTTVFLYNDDIADDHPDNYTPYDESKLAEHGDVSKIIEAYKKQEELRKEAGTFDPQKLPLLFAKVPHYFHKGSIDVSKLPIITAKLKDDSQ